MLITARDFDPGRTSKNVVHQYLVPKYDCFQSMQVRSSILLQNGEFWSKIY